MYRRWLPVALAVTALANVAASPFLPVSALPVRPHSSGSLTHLVHTEQRTVDLRYGIYMELGDVLAGETLYVPEDSPLSADLARGLANVILEELDYDPTDLTGAVPEGEPLGSFQAEDERIPYWILRNGGDTRWWLGRTVEGLVVVPETVAPLPEAGR